MPPITHIRFALATEHLLYRNTAQASVGLKLVDHLAMSRSKEWSLQSVSLWLRPFLSDFPIELVDLVCKFVALSNSHFQLSIGARFSVESCWSGVPTNRTTNWTETNMTGMVEVWDYDQYSFSEEVWFRRNVYHCCNIVRIVPLSTRHNKLQWSCSDGTGQMSRTLEGERLVHTPNAGLHRVHINNLICDCRQLPYYATLAPEIDQCSAPILQYVKTTTGLLQGRDQIGTIEYQPLNQDDGPLALLCEIILYLGERCEFCNFFKTINIPKIPSPLPIQFITPF